MDDCYDTPPLVPERETVAAHEPIFVDACLAALAADAEKFGWVYGNSLVTKSQKWGLIWRVDFVTPRSASSRLVNRAMCWGNEDSVDGMTIAFGQQIAPLE